MLVDMIDNRVEGFIGERRSIDDIKSSYPDEWILLGNPIREEGQKQSITSGIVLYHGRDKREVCYSGRSLTKNFKRVALFFNRITPHEPRPVIASFYSTLNI